MKRFLSLMLAFILVFGMLPANSVTAMAEKKDKYDCDIDFGEYGKVVRNIKNKDESKNTHILRVSVVMDGEYLDTKEVEVLEYNDRFLIQDENIYSYIFNVGDGYELERCYICEDGDIYWREVKGNKITHYPERYAEVLYYVKEKQKEVPPAKPEKPSVPDIAENGEIIKVNWQRTKEGRGNTLTVNKSSRLKWNWSSVPQKLTNFGERVWDGSTNNSFSGLKVGHSSATWRNEPSIKDQSTFRRFRGTFEIPKGYTSKDQIVVSSVAQSLYSKYGNIIPINDDIFIFVYKDGESINNRNFIDYLAFWTGTSNQNGITTFNGVRGTDTVWLNGDGKLPSNHPLKHTDGWYCEADYDNIGDSLYKNYPDAKEGEKFIIDVITSDYANIGGMDELKISIGKLTDKAVTIKYYEGNVEDGKEIHSVSRKNLKAGEKINLSSDELNIAKDKLSDKDIFGDGIQVGGEYTVGYDKEQVIKVYYPLKVEPKYRVEHYLMDKDGTYSSSPTVETKTGKLGENAKAVPKEYTHHKLDENNKNSVTQGQITGPEQLVLKLYYAREQYKVSYDANVPETETIAVPKDETVYAETEVTISEAPLRNGYTFKGWDTEKINSDNKIYAPKDRFTAEADVTFYAQWEKDSTRWHKVIYNANGGTGSQKDDTEYLTGTDVDILGKGEITREHNTFDSWNTQSDGKGRKYQEGEKITAIRSGVTLYAQWKENDKFTVKYDANAPQGATLVGKAPVDTNQYYNNDKAIVASDSEMNIKNYTFQGWFTAPIGGEKVSGEITVTGNTTLYAQWKENNKFAVTYDANVPQGATLVGKAPVDTNQYYNNDKAIVASDSEMNIKNYVFQGWFAAPTGGEKVSGEITVTGNITLYAQWKENVKFTVTYDANAPQGTTLLGKSPVDTNQYYSNDKAIVASDSEMSIKNYTFQGWFTAPIGGEKVSGEITVTGNTTLYAQWKENNKFAVTYDANVPQGATLVGKAPVDTKQYYSNDKVIVASDSEMNIKNYVFQGWFTAPTGGEKVSGEITVTGNITLYAQWKENDKFTVTYDANAPQGTTLLGKAPVDTNQYYSNDKAIVASDSEMSIKNYTFQGWFTALTGGEKVSGEITVTGNTTLYAQWKESDKFTLSYNSNGGSEAAPPSITVYEGENVEVASDRITRVGFERDGWNTSPDAKGIHYADGTEIKLTKNIELFAQWNKTDGMWHKVSYEANLPEGITELTSGQLPIDENEYLVGDSAIISQNNMKISGYTFMGWKAENDETIYNVGSSYSVRGEKDTLYAQWQKAEGEWFNVIYDANGGKDEPKTAEYLAGTRVTVAERGEMYKAGFTFDGWTDGSVDYQVGEKFAMPNSHVTLKAKWAEIQGEISITHRYFTNGSFDGETADENVEVGYQFSIANFLKALFNSIRYEARISEIKVERRLIEEVEDEVAVESVTQEIKAEVTEKPSEEMKSDETAEKPSEEMKSDETTEKPSEEIKSDETAEKPSEEIKSDETAEKPSEEMKSDETAEKPSEEMKSDETTEKPSEEMKSDETTEKPSEQATSDVVNEVEVLAGISEDLDETVVELKEKELEIVETEETIQEAKSEEKSQEKLEEAVKEERESEWETVNGDGGNYIFEEGYEYRVIINYYRTTSSSGGGGSHHRPNHRPSGGDTDKTVTILDEEVPLSQSPELFTIVDEEVPLGKLPKTGGNSLSVEAAVVALAILSSSLKKKFGKSRK